MHNIHCRSICDMQNIFHNKTPLALFSLCLYTFIEPYATPITTDPFLQAIAIPNATLQAHGVVFS